ncbi:MAG: TetR/AcrR family transcriptional regulator [Ignavibacteriaceae bacterium]|nr:TetR/AcrR family transcriptional regulator [Ignavibacteriaceae bacterium]
MRNKREEILRAAEKRFVKHGPLKTTVDEIARDLRIAKSTIYHYFKSKDELFITILKKQINNYLDELKHIFNNEELDTKGKIRSYIELKIELRKRYRLIYGMMLATITKKLIAIEPELLASLIREEEKIINLFLNALNHDEILITGNKPLFITLHSFLLVFMNNLFFSTITVDESKMTDRIIDFFENFLENN